MLVAIGEIKRGITGLHSLQTEPKPHFMKTILLISMLSLLSLSNEAVFSQNINKPNISGPAGLRVNSFSGSLFYQRNDLMIPCRGIPIKISFFYNSATTAIDYGFGPGWSFTYSMKVIPGSNIATVWLAEGRKEVFTYNGSAYIAQAGIFDSLAEYLPGKFRLTTKTGTKYFFENATHKRLTKITDRNNNQLTITYTDSLVTMITDPSGRSISLNYTDGHLTEITDPNTAPARHITYAYDANSQLVTVTDPMNNVIHYSYDVVKNLIQLKDQSNNEFNVTYMNCANVSDITSPISSMHFEYDTLLRKTTVTEPVNNITQSTSYHFDTNGNLEEKIGSCCGFHQLFSYDAYNNMIGKTNANGGITYYSYDLQGNNTLVTDPLGHMTAYTFIPGGYSQVSSKTDPLGNVWSCSYDANGNLIQENKPLGVSEQYTYDAYGNRLTATDGRGNTTQYQYNTHGDITLMTFPGGATNSFTYDNAGNRLTLTNARGFTTTYTYDLLNRRTQTTDALGNVTTYAYDSRGNETSVTDPLGHAATCSYDALNRKTGTTTPAGTSSRTLDEKGNVLSETDNNGNVRSFTYNLQNLLTTETDALGHTRSISYDMNGNKLTETDFSSNLITYSNDASDRLTGITDPLLHTTTILYDANGNNTSVTDANGNTILMVYDSLNRQKQKDRMGATAIYSYDAADNKISYTDPNGHTTTYTFDARNRLTGETDALGHSKNYAYDLQGNRVAVTDRNGHTTTFTYDALDRIISESNPAGETTLTAYDAAGNTLSKTLSNGNVITNTYDAANRLTTTSDLLGTLKSFTYDANSNPLSGTDGNGHTTSVTYDARNRIITVTDPLGNAKTLTYNNDSKLLSEQDRNGHTTTYTYDALHRRIQSTYPLGNQMWETYDAVGNVLTKTDNNSNISYFTYDAYDHLITETFPDATMKHYTYDAVGNMTSRTDNKGHQVNYVYDAINRLTTRDYPGSNDDSFTYNNEFGILTAVNSNATLTYSYDGADRILTESLNGKITSYSYDVLNSKIIKTYPGGRTIEEDYNGRVQLAAVKDGATSLTLYTYDAGGRMVNRTYSNGVVAAYSYNNNNWITSLSHTKSSVLAQFNYSFDNEGNRLYAEKTHRTGHSEKYVYDANDRLSNYKEGTLTGGSIPSPLTQTQYNYDGAGNRTTMVKDALTTTYTSNNLHEYTSTIAGTSIILPAYDANGNLVSDGTYTNTFDDENRLIAVTGGPGATYKYDALGRRIQKVTASGTVNYFYSGARIIEERNGSDMVQATYVYGTSTDDLLSMNRGNVDYFYHQNSLGSVAAITDNTGAVAERYEYDAYGRPSIYDGSYNLRTVTAIGNSYMFTGREYDAETGYYHYRARLYTPDWGRFGQRDPLEESEGTTKFGNPFIYVGNNPLNHTDSKGMDSDDDKMKKIKEWAKDQLRKAFYDAVEKAKEDLTEKLKEKIEEAIGEGASAVGGLFIDYTKFELEVAQAIVGAAIKIANVKNACLICSDPPPGHQNNDPKWIAKQTIRMSYWYWEWCGGHTEYYEYPVYCIEKEGQLFAMVPDENRNDHWVPCFF